ncbi:MAG: DUF2321 domain-containing protein [Methanothrix sp.]|nr:DUF2321 domain-containing protein [Methanothrix sp.]
MGYDALQVCLNGHLTTDYYHNHPHDRKDYCNICGEKTIYLCQRCNKELQGARLTYINGILCPGLSKTAIPDYCKYCGSAFPWAEMEKKLGTISDLQNPIKHVEHICTRFHLAAKQLVSRHNHRQTLKIEDEYDVQDLLHSLLRLFFDDIRPEEWTPSYAGGSSRMDFLLRNESIVIETKKTRDTLGSKELGDQLIIDIERYQKHTYCKTLICFVYDPDELIANPSGIEKDLNRQDGDLSVKVLIMPKRY